MAGSVRFCWEGFVTPHRPGRTGIRLYELLSSLSEGNHGKYSLAQIAEKLNDEGFVPPRRRGLFTVDGVGSLVRDLGLVGELFRDDLVGKDEWWITDLARKLGVVPQKIHYWVKQSWVHSRRTPSGKHLIVWADKDEISRLRQLARRKNSWIAARHPELVVPKRRPAGSR